MPVMPDLWIREMALRHPMMIEPFVESQKRDGVISYGLSSYGYDARAADEFKIFTNVDSALVDPKAFDPKSFVDRKTDVCIVPPNSFALTRTIEYFRIPRNILTICLGKCLTADTRVVDAETGALRPIGEFRWGMKTLALHHWRLEPAGVSALIPQGRKPVFELRTRTGLKIRCTANHPFRQLHGWTELQHLSPGDRIAVARRIPVFGNTPIPDWECSLLGLMISEGQCRTPSHSPVFTSADPVLVELLRRSVDRGGLGTVTARPSYGYRLVNKKGRGGIPEKNRAYRWLCSHELNVTAEDKFVPQAIFTAPRESVRLFLQALFSSDGGVYRSDECCFIEYYSKSRRLIEDVHHLLLRFGVFSLIREKITSIGTYAAKIQITDREQIKRFTTEVGFCSGSIKQRRLETEILPFIERLQTRRRSNFDTLPAAAWSLIRAAAQASAGRTLASAGLCRTQPSQSVSLSDASAVTRTTQDAELSALAEGPVWDVVESITPADEEDVFDISVPVHHNFVANDIVVHNSTYARCGIIVNVTPLEPEWEGHVTIEISNTTPLPAKIYANEGICQFIFLKSDRPCETSYADRAGKYMKQRGVTLPRL